MIVNGEGPPVRFYRIEIFLTPAEAQAFLKDINPDWQHRVIHKNTDTIMHALQRVAGSDE